MSNRIVVDALNKELDHARRLIANALHAAGQMDEISGKERSTAETRIAAIQKAVAYYDEVVEELEKAESARVLAFNASANAVA
jgi:hypothetical protein